MTTTSRKSTRPSRCGFSPACRLTSHGLFTDQHWQAAWNGKAARERDGSVRHFPTESLARAWLAAADATNGESFRHQCS